MPWIFDVIVILGIIIVLVLLTVRLRFKLLNLWTDVSAKEVLFHKLLLDTTIIFYENKLLIQNEDNLAIIKKLSKYRKKKLRNLLLKERQDLFYYLNTIYDDFDEIEDTNLDVIKQTFADLQKARRLYNTKVLVYNQTISVFPTRFLAIKMNLQIKEYFG
ncbi:MAG: LemA family protein [Candidatus Izimaplasma sp.]|nr:LemA family protein [Candidatus Izimaplasma bacterium]